MKTLLLFFSLVIFSSTAQNILVPQPQSLSYGEGYFVLKSNNVFYNTGVVNTHTLQAIKRLREGLRYRTNYVFDEKIQTSKSNAMGFLVEAKNTTHVFPGMNESYTLSVDSLGVSIKAETSVGTLRAVETLLQLVKKQDSLWVIPALTITDEPRFVYRGLMLDPVRRFLSVDALKRNIRAMAGYKLNVLHLHLSDDQGWRMESKRYPSLHIMSSDGYYYTQNQLTDVVRYAEERGILIIPEFDIPGHSTALLVAKPGLASKEQSYGIERSMGIQKPVLNPAIEETYAFLSNLFKEVDSLFPGPYIHIGGDEVEFDHWVENASIDAFRAKMGLKDFNALERYFINRVADSISLTGKTIIGWEEIHGDGLQKGAVLQCWKSNSTAVSFANQGYKTIRSQGLYLDLLYPLSDYYNLDIIPKTLSLSKEQAANFLGAEACMWGEFTGERNVDFRVWPRMAMIAERLWSVEKRDKRALASAVQKTTIALAEFGLNHIGSPYTVMCELAQSKNIAPLEELRGLVTPLKGYERHLKFLSTVLSPLNEFADAADTDPMDLELFYKALREFIIAGTNESNFEFVAQKLFEWEAFYATNKTYFNSNPKLKELEPLAKNLSAAAKVANEAMDYIVRGKIPKDAWITNAKAVMEEAKKPVANVELVIIEQLEKLVVFSKEHDVIVF